MAIERLTEDISYISKLDNEPNDVGGFTPEELKAEFDKAANVIKAYLNETLIPLLEGLGLEVAINYKSDNLKFMRIGTGGLLETSPDGVNWFAALTKGEPGPAGPGPYEVALEKGYGGTSEEFYDALIQMPAVVEAFAGVKATAEEAKTVADAALPKSGGKLTGPLYLTENVHYGVSSPADVEKGRFYLIEAEG